MTHEINRTAFNITRTPWALALACTLGLTAIGGDAFAQVTSTPRRGGSSSTPSPGVTRDSEGRIYLPSELDKPVDEFIMGPTAYSQPQGNTQITIGGMMQVQDQMQMSGIMGRVEYGITNQFEVHGSVPISMTQTAGSTSVDPVFDRIELGALYNLTQMNDPVMLSAAFDAEIPISGEAGRAVVLKPSLLVGGDLGAVELHSSVQAEFNGPASGLNFDIGGAYSLGQWVPTLELNSRATENAHPEVYVTPGVFYNLSNRTEIGVGVPIGLNDQSPTSVMAKVNFSF